MLNSKWKSVLWVWIMLLTTAYGYAVEINTTIQTGSDDVEERASGRVSSSSGDLELVYDSGNQVIGLRFVNLDIPQGATISSSYLQFTVDETSSEETLLNIYGQKVENAEAFGTDNFNVSSRVKTLASVSWSVPVWNTTKVSEEAQKSPELKSIVQEIVNLEGWTNNNNIVFMIDGSGKRVADSYEGGSERVPKLYISYEVNNEGEDNNTDRSIDDNNFTVSSIDVSVSHKYDDAEESESGSTSRSSSDLELVYDGSHQTIGLRFIGLDIPVGATITNAHLQFTADETDTEDTQLNIYAQKSATPEAYESVAFNISSREKTLASVSWNVPVWETTLESAEKQTTPNLKALVQEVIDLDSWAANSNMAFIIDGTGKRVADSFEGGADKATKLHIEFTTGSDSNITDGGSDNNTSDGGEDTNTTDGGTDNNTTEGGNDDTNSTDGGDNNTTNGDGTDTNQTLISKSIDIPISYGNDDVEEAQTGAIYMDSSDLELVHDGIDQTIGLRFTNLNIPQGATITSASIQFNTDEVGHTDATVLNIYAQNIDNAPTFTSSSYNVSSRDKTTASAVWDVPEWSVLDEHSTAQQTPELKLLVQEVVNRSGWTKNSALAFIIEGIGHRTADSYEGGTEKAPTLHVEYEFLQDVVVLDPAVTSFVEDSSVNVFNPDRGLYTADYDLAQSTSWNMFHDAEADGYRMVYSPINLYDYTDTTTLPSSVLETINENLVDAETKGVKLILRFKYREDESNAYQDPALSTILGHMEQLRDILQSHKEIISVVQAGTIGAWGEWNRFTGEFADSNANYKSNRRAVIAKLVDIFPNKFIQIRTPMHKELLYGTSAEYKDEGVEGKITTDIAYTEDIRAKIGHHNDCLLADDTNYGTYGSNVNFWKDYVSNDSKYTPLGGETCWIEPGFEVLSDCEYSLDELKRLQYSYLNNVYQVEILNKWRNQGCYQEIKENLGYRLVATNLNSVKSDDNSTLSIALTLENKGFAAPYIKSSVNFILKSSNNIYTFNQADVDTRKFYASGTKDVSTDLSLIDVESGEYCLYLQIGENFSAIRLSNSQNSDGVDMWNESLKSNTLKCGIEL
ncbi:MAG: Unknown protein [uncultured Sulfurovum sp.]|uniref:DUF4832 domain-containing protein n=1 Tax=uncultured Sulfurovum sp. TaxID=269237 RepID=A0A6S6SZJ7_9BACT|nr:MAG: Unknown protein [uncultured Sulfurovum sp.]